MTPSFRLQAVDAQAPGQTAQLATLWTAACGDDLAISPQFVAYNLNPSAGVRQAAVIGLLDDEPVGFVAASVIADHPAVMPADHGWIDAIAVAPAAQRQGVGSRLLAWAEGWLLGQGCRTFRLGGSLHPFVPGVPVELSTADFFTRQGYAGRAPDAAAATVWDMAADLGDYTPPPTVHAIDGQVRPATPADRAALSAFLQREFPGRWHVEFEHYLAAGGRIADYMVLWTAAGVDGFCILTFPDSPRPIERFYPYRLPRPWGQLGSVGVSADRRGRGYGAALIDAGLRRLHNNGINGCIIDWTDLVDLYAKFGFTPYRGYLALTKQV